MLELLDAHGMVAQKNLLKRLIERLITYRLGENKMMIDYAQKKAEVFEEG